MFKQSLLPGFPDGAQRIGESLSILERDGRVVIPKRTLMNWTARYRKHGPTSFFANAPVVKPPVMNTEMSAHCVSLLAQEIRPSVVARQVGINESTLRKALKRQAIAELPKAAQCAAPEGGQLGRQHQVRT